jgi:hypothetical protein
MSALICATVLGTAFLAFIVWCEIRERPAVAHDREDRPSGPPRM